MSYSGAQITRLGLAAIPRALYGSFAGKAAAEMAASFARAGQRLVAGTPVNRLIALTPDNRLTAGAPANRLEGV